MPSVFRTVQTHTKQAPKEGSTLDNNNNTWPDYSLCRQGTKIYTYNIHTSIADITLAREMREGNTEMTGFYIKRKKCHANLNL